MSTGLNTITPRHGAQWVRAGMQVFGKQPLAMSGLFFMFIATVSLLSIVPVIGPFFGLIAIPALTAGIMHATQEATKGLFPSPLLLFAPLRTDATRTRRLLILGLMYALCFLAIMGISALIDGGQLAKLYLVGGKLDAETLADPSFVVAMYVMLACYLPISLAFWHAPALVYWENVSPAKSVFFSAVACFKNFRAFTVYGFLWFACMLAAGMVASVLGIFLGTAVHQALMMIAVLIVASMFFASIYFTYRDSFITTPPAETPEEPPHESA